MSLKNRYRKLQKIYAQLPTIDCTGECWVTCTAVPAANLERQMIKLQYKQALFAMPDTFDMPRCSCLKNNRCSVYQHRPLICRLYGVTEGMRCLFGCRPDRYLTDDEAGRLLSEAYRIGE